MPYFSVIIPVYNKEKFIKNTLKSVLSQTFTDFEILVINDGSTDNSENRILEFTDKRIHYFSKKNEGVSTARNLGIEKACADYIFFLDADDYWYPEFLETLHQYTLKFPLQKVFGSAFEIETSKKIFPAAYSITKTNDFELVNYFEASMKESVLWTSSACFHKEVFETIGDFDNRIKSGQDTDLWIRIGLAYPILFIWKIQARYVYDANSLSKNKEYLNTKFDFSKFSAWEKTNPGLKKFLDLNRFSLAIKSKLVNDKRAFNKYYNAIDLKRLPFKKRIILKLPSLALKILIRLKLTLANIGLGNSVFK
ncbi:MAG: glycosyltransferase family 2 protein [Flavobacterium sp.]